MGGNDRLGDWRERDVRGVAVVASGLRIEAEGGAGGESEALLAGSSAECPASDDSTAKPRANAGLPAEASAPGPSPVALTMNPSPPPFS
jgi:hypothetical protein